MPANPRQITPEAGTFVPARGTVALHCSVARPVFGVIPDVWTTLFNPVALATRFRQSAILNTA